MGVLCNRETKAGEGNNERQKSAVLNDREKEAGVVEEIQEEVSYG
jgi:hypothetical protein